MDGSGATAYLEGDALADLRLESVDWLGKTTSLTDCVDPELISMDSADGISWSD
jgi:hypothetical protein